MLSLRMDNLFNFQTNNYLLSSRQAFREALANKVHKDLIQ